MKFEYPLQWLPQRRRNTKPELSRFGSRSVSYAGDMLAAELRRLGARNCIITSNLRVRNDGGFYAQQSRIDDPGIAVYFDLKGKKKAMLMDKWRTPQDNIWALYLSISSIRGLERWGGAEFLDGLFTGFQALPDYSNDLIRYFDDCPTEEELKKRYRNLCMEMHPDRGGNSQEFIEMKNQFEELKRSFTGGN